MSSSSKFWDKIAGRYSRQPIADEASYNSKLEITRSYFKPDMEVVELGCGTGSTAILHAPYVKHIRAIDISPKMIEIARQKAVSSGIENITFETLPIDAVNAKQQSVDVVLAMSILHLVENKAAVIKKIYDMLKPGGIFVSSTICLADDMRWLKAIVPLGKALGFMPLIKFFSKIDLESCIKKEGFEIEHSWKPGDKKAVFIVSRKP